MRNIKKNIVKQFLSIQNVTRYFFEIMIQKINGKLVLFKKKIG